MADSYYQSEGTLRPEETPINTVSEQHVLAFPVQYIKKPAANYTDEAADIPFTF